MIFLFNGLDACLRHCHIKYKRNLLMTGKHFYARRMVEFPVLFEANPDFADVLRFYILLQPLGKRPAKNIIAIAFKEGSNGVKIFSKADGDGGMFL